ncbi:MAG: ATP-dependent Clp protease adapter ClpS [Thermodesulfobacteriota bacterium]|nr:ATP-dependent Clp protease adapter ClpS [Thermodesulfobacteriota bacterium]
MTNRNTDIQPGTVQRARERNKVKPPSLYRVLLHNDDYTTMEFVVEVLQHVFRKTFEEATMIMLNVHHHGIGICGVFTYEIAETRIDMVHNTARERGFPLKCTMEKE